jgi:hypothetical protein
MSLNKIAIAFFLLLYVSGYHSARLSKWIVHRASYYSASNGTLRIADHSVIQGDFGMAMFNLPGSSLPWAVSKAYWPLRQLEEIYWKVKLPPGTEWPSDWEQEKSP